MRRLLVFICVTAAVGSAQTRTARPPTKQRVSTPAATPEKRPLEALQVEGNTVYTREQVLAVAGIEAGQSVGRYEFEEARRRLEVSGAFDSVSYEYAATAKGGYIGTLRVSEAEPVLPVRFEDLGIADTELAQLLSRNNPLFTSGKLASARPVLDRTASLIQDHLRSKGIQEDVSGSVEGAPDKLVIVFRPPRPLPAVAEVSFEGDADVSETTLREAVAGSAIGVPYREEHFREILEHSVLPVYEARGRIRVAFPSIRVERAADVQGLRVIVTVAEGETYRLGNVKIAGPAPISHAELLKAGKFKTGETANFDLVRDSVENITKILRRTGYLDARFATERSIDDAKKTVDLTLRLDPGPQYTMGKLSIDGLDLLGEAEIRRMWNMKPGRPFNPEYPERFLESVREQSLFDKLGDTNAEVKPRQDHTVDVTLKFAKSAPERKVR